MNKILEPDYDGLENKEKRAFIKKICNGAVAGMGLTVLMTPTVSFGGRIIPPTSAAGPDEPKGSKPKKETKDSGKKKKKSEMEK